jgi:2-polyprenyl-6-methoxyphenol hydroxylase-like FAD-dependent oxidoreductase
MRIAISGAGIAGPSLAHWLHQSGHEATLIEKAPRFRTGGYVIDFWGVGYTIAERMGVLLEVLEAGSSFLPETAVRLWLRNQVTRLMRLPGIADWLIGRSVIVSDDFDLPNYSM